MGKEQLKCKVVDVLKPVQAKIRIDQTIDEALAELREAQLDEAISYFYVVDKEGKLLGVVPTRHLLLKKPSTPIKEVMDKNVITIRDDETMQSAMEILSSHKLLALPVINKEGILLGSVDIQMVLEETRGITSTRDRMDIFQLVGITLEDRKVPSAWRSYKSRMPWITCNMAAGLICAIIAKAFDLVIDKVIILAFFIPLVLSLSESISMQSTTQSLQMMRKDRIIWKTVFQKVFSEWRTLAYMGLTAGISIGAFSLLWGEGVMPALTIGTSIACSVTITGALGSLVPLFLHSKRLDPKVSSGPIVLMFADVFTTALYLSLATWWLL